MLKKISSIVFTAFKYICVAHCITEHVGDVFLVSSFRFWELWVMYLFWFFFFLVDGVVAAVVGVFW